MRSRNLCTIIRDNYEVTHPLSKIPGYATGLGHNIARVVLNLPTNFGLLGSSVLDLSAFPSNRISVQIYPTV